jgi:hypothetical protein
VPLFKILVQSDSVANGSVRIYISALARNFGGAQVHSLSGAALRLLQIAKNQPKALMEIAARP